MRMSLKIEVNCWTEVFSEALCTMLLEERMREWTGASAACCSWELVFGFSRCLMDAEIVPEHDGFWLSAPSMPARACYDACDCLELVPNGCTEFLGAWSSRL